MPSMNGLSVDDDGDDKCWKLPLWNTIGDSRGLLGDLIEWPDTIVRPPEFSPSYLMVCLRIWLPWVV